MWGALLDQANLALGTPRSQYENGRLLFLSWVKVLGECTCQQEIEPYR